MTNRPCFIFVNPNSSEVKQIKISLFKFFFGIIFTFLVLGILVKISIDLGVKFNQNSLISQLENENSILQQQVRQMDNQIKTIRLYMNQIEDLDDKIRVRLDVPIISDDVREVGIGGSDINFLSSVELEDMKLKSSIVGDRTLLDRLEREIKLESESFKSLLAIIDRKEDSLRFLPAIKPVPNGRITDGFGKRRHPIFKRIIPHHGIDLAAKRGTPILASADGYVTFTGRNGGYGLFVSINHKYGFDTKYGHLQKIYVRRGQFVKRGDKIGEVGNTGISTAPHLHYEIHYKGKPVDPTDYYFPDIKFE